MTILYPFTSCRAAPFLPVTKKKDHNNYGTLNCIFQNDMNVIVVDWSGGSFDPYDQAVANTRVVGAVISELVIALHNTTQLDYSNVHLIGHSLGSHICGFAGERIPGLGRITGKLQVKINC